MNNKLIITAVSSLFLGGVFTATGLLVAYNTRREKYENRQTETREVSGFTKLNIDSLGKISIKQGDVESLSIEADEAYLKNIRTEVKDGTLSIKDENHTKIVIFDFATNDRVNLNVTVKKLDELTLKGVGDVSVDSLLAEDFVLNADGMGDISISKVQVNNLTYTHNGAGELDIDQIIARSVKMKLSGMGDTTFGNLQAASLNIDWSGAGTVSVKGKIDDLYLDKKGLGDFEARNLVAKTATLFIDGGGDTELSVTDSITLDKKGFGDLTYYGDPRINSKSGGAGRIDRGGDLPK
jgi:hypothetical protein